MNDPQHTKPPLPQYMVSLLAVGVVILLLAGWIVFKGYHDTLYSYISKLIDSHNPSSVTVTTSSNAVAANQPANLVPAANEQYQQEEFMLVSNVKIQMGMSQRYLESKLGIPQESYKNRQIWQFANGSRFAASFNEYGVSDASLSSNNPAEYFSYYGVKVTPGIDSIASIENKIEGGCYHFGWFMQYALAEYVVRGGPEGSWLINFSTTGASGDDEVTDAQLKNQKILSVSFGYHDSEPSVEEKYCTGDTAGVASSITPAPATDATTAGQYNLPAYSGNPLTDNAFNQFIQQNIDGKIQLKLNIADQNARYRISDGYRGGDPSFKPLQNSKFNYLVFIDCSGIDNPEAETPIERCAPSVQWNEQTGQLSGMFRVDVYGEDAGNTLIHLFAM